jgi:U3 small nucleolar RNA-associated protein 19
LIKVSSEAIYKVFHLLCSEGSYRTRHFASCDQSSSVSIGESQILGKWLDSIYLKFYKRSFELLSLADRENIGFENVMQLIRLSAVGVSEDYFFPVEIIRELLEVIIKSNSSSVVFDLFDETVNSYRDIRYYSLRVLGQICQSIQKESSKDENAALKYYNLFKIISEIVMESDAEIESGDVEPNPFLVEISLPAALSSCRGHLQEFSSCWLNFLQGVSSISPKLHRSFLLIVNDRVIPYMIKPALLADYLTDSFNSGGLVSLLALNGLFTLMHRHNLDYPLFFTKLYSILDSNILHCRYRKKFCKLFGIFMTSTHMPAYLVAAFVKRISRLSLDASPAVINWVIPFVYNMFKAHPAVRVLIHRQSSGEDSKLMDPFSMDELDPSKCRAIDSSIWEIHALSRHYWTGAIKQSRIFTERLTKPPFDLNNCLDGPTYNSLIQEELSHPWSKVPPLNITISNELF